MAHAVLFNIGEKILGELNSLVLEEIGVVLGVKGELEKLKDTFSAINGVLLDAEKQESESNAVKDWLEKLKDAVYEADDVLDSFSAEALRRKVTSPNKMAREVSIFFSSSNQIVFNLKMGHKIKAIRERLDKISADRKQFQLDENRVEPRAQNRARQRTHSFVLREKVIGRDGDKEEIVKQLLDSDVRENVSILPIVGRGGLGKTTLAKQVYNDERIKENFQPKIWVDVPKDFDVQLIAEKIIGSVTAKEHRYLNMDQVQMVLRKQIEQKKYLLVLDNVWVENLGKWLQLKELLMGGAVGSKILVTSRSHTVAKITGTVRPHVLGALSDDQSWSLFEQMALPQGQELEPSTIAEIRKHIIAKCAGVPLAIRTLGSLLYSKDPHEWLNFASKELSKINQDENDILPILKISYDNFPSVLKHCFAYCSLFPRGHRIHKQTLINLWVAQGFVLPSDGDQYFMDLLGQSFFEDVEKDGWGNVISCKMHDLMHDLAQQVAGKECSRVNLDLQNTSVKSRHLSINVDVDLKREVVENLLRVKQLRTLLLVVPSWIGRDQRRLSKSTCESLMSSLKHLRVLDLHESGIEVVPGCVGKLKLLRYLDLSRNNGIKRLPSSICRLQNLQTLKLSACCCLKELPRDMGKLISLIHLQIDGCHELTHMPRNLGQLTSLQTLSRFVVGRFFSMHDGGLAELNALKNLKGELEIVNLGNVKSPMSKSKAANLREKQHLERLTLEWEPEASGAEVASEDEVLLDGLQPHPNLKELSLVLYGGGRFPTWMSNNLVLCLPKLVKISLRNCRRCQYLPPLSQLPSLKFLDLHEMTAVEYLDNRPYQLSNGGRSTTFFPSLEELGLFELRNLKGWWKKETINDDNGGQTTTESMVEHQHLLVPSFPCLSKLVIWKCPKLISMPLIPCLEELRLLDLSVKMLQLSMAMTATSDQSSTTTAASTSSSLSSHVSKLKSLWIAGIDDLEYIPEEYLLNLTSLKHLEISSCHKLRILPEEGLRGLTSLRTLQIFKCESLSSLSRGIQYLSALEELRIRCCKELDMSDANDDGKPWQGLRNLSLLDLYKIPKLVSLPEWLQQVTSLQSLIIESCDGLVTLPEWIGSLTSLQRLQIADCPKLTTLPEGMFSLKALKQLKIENCPALLESCRQQIELIGLRLHTFQS